MGARFGVCFGGWAMKERVPGLDYMEGYVPKMLVPTEDDKAFEAKLAETRGLPAPVEAGAVFLPADMKTTGPNVNETVLDAYATKVLARAQKAGMKIMAFGSGGSRQAPDGFDKKKALGQLAGHMKRWGPIAKKCGITFAIEPLQSAECNMINNLAEAAELARMAGHPHVRVLADIFHMGRAGDGPEEMMAVKDLIVHVHTAEQDGRKAPGTHREDQRRFFKALKEMGYQGGISIECGWDDPIRELPGALAYLIEQYQSA